MTEKNDEEKEEGNMRKRKNMNMRKVNSPVL
jgi:hypothetical protein